MPVDETRAIAVLFDRYVRRNTARQRPFVSEVFLRLPPSPRLVPMALAYYCMIIVTTGLSYCPPHLPFHAPVCCVNAGTVFTTAVGCFYSCGRVWLWCCCLLLLLLLLLVMLLVLRLFGYTAGVTAHTAAPTAAPTAGATASLLFLLRVLQHCSCGAAPVPPPLVPRRTRSMASGSTRQEAVR